MAKRYQDAMATVRKLGNQHFMTFTFNAQWPEILSHLQP